MNEKKIIIFSILITITLLVGGIFFVSTSTATPSVISSSNAKATTIDPTSADWGQIPMFKGTVSKVFRIKNTGTNTLKLFNIRTSCHCTTAEVITPTDTSPLFKMDSLSSWIGTVDPGKEAKLTVVFDPAFHGPDAVGPITRYVEIETNDKAEPKLTFTVTGNVYK
ncbi:MAG TPA: DUF1573 domain-containing protein [Patescibacteria group bacterium]